MHSLIPRAALLLALACTGCHQQAPPPSDGPLLPNYIDRGIVVLDANPQRPNYWDFDVVTYGERPKHVFRLKNLEPTTVTIHNVQPSCGCVLATLSSPGQPLVRGLLAPDAAPFRLVPGAVAELELAVDTTVVEVMNADKLVTVRIACDSPNSPYLGFEAHLKVTRDFLCSPRLIDLGQIPQGFTKQAGTSVVNEPMRLKALILGLERVEGPYTAHVDEEAIDDRRTWRVSVDAKEDAPFGLALGKVVLKTSGGDGTGTGLPFEIPISGQVVPRILATPAALRLTIVQDVAEIVVECLVPEQTVAIRKVRFEGAGPDFAVEFAPVKPENGRAAKWKVALHVTRAGAGGGYTRTAVIELDDPLIPELRVPVTVETR